MCTSIFWHTANGPLIANNEDIFLETGMLFSNQRGIAKQALLLPPDPPQRWVSRFGSLTFSQCGKEFPSAGMNEAGLVIEQMTLRETRYPAADGRPALNELQFIQFLLDTCATVEEALSQAASVRIAQASALIHYLLVDRAGDAAIIEFLDGKMVVFHGADLPVFALTNSTYTSSLGALAQPDASGHTGDDYQKDSLRRFEIAARRAQNGLGEDAFRSAFEGLEEAARPDTIWNIVYAPASGKIHVRTRWNAAVRTVDLARFDFSPSASGLVYDLRAAGQGDVSPDFASYTTATNHALVVSFFRNKTIMQVLGFALPDEMIDGFAAYPASLLPV